MNATIANLDAMAGFSASDGWSDRPENMTKENDIITIESEDGILHEMIVKSVDQNNRTVTGEVAHWKASLHHAADDKKIVRTITVPDHCIRERP